MRKRRVWFFRPQWSRPEWSPITRGHDDHARWNLVIGWSFTGQIVIATRSCGDPDCEAWAVRYAEEMAEDEDD